MSTTNGPPGGAVPRVKVDEGAFGPVTRHSIPPTNPAAPQAFRALGDLGAKPDGSHMAPEVRARLGDLDGPLAAGIRRAADTK